MAEIVKPIGPEVAVGTTANLISTSKLLRIYNPGAAVVVHLQANSSGGEYANTTVGNNYLVIIQKTNITDWIIANNCLVTPVAYTN
jgi:hypothetical protein